MLSPNLKLHYWKIFLAVVLLLPWFAACQKKDKTLQDIPGSWREIESDDGYGYQLYDVSFACDSSFIMKITYQGGDLDDVTFTITGKYKFKDYMLELYPTDTANFDKDEMIWFFKNGLLYLDNQPMEQQEAFACN